MAAAGAKAAWATWATSWATINVEGGAKGRGTGYAPSPIFVYARGTKLLALHCFPIGIDRRTRHKAYCLIQLGSRHIGCLIADGRPDHTMQLQLWQPGKANVLYTPNIAV